MHPVQAVLELSRVTSGRCFVSTGVGQHQMHVAQHYDFQDPRDWISSGALGCMGYGLPAAVGAASLLKFSAQAPGREFSLVIDGDGSFQMNPQELATVATNGLNVKICILNNQVRIQSETLPPGG